MISKQDADRFWSKVDRRGPDECWPWKAGCSRGQGMFWLNGKTVVASRVAFFLEHGRWPDPCGCHSCDNRPCCNPAHVWEGTKADNTAGMVAKGRQRAVGGESHYRAKLTADLVRQIRRAPQLFTHEQWAAQAGVSRPTITYMIQGRTWRHV